MRLALALLTVLALAASPAPAAAEGEPSLFGMVNLSLLYNFHPLVQTFVPSEGKFMKLDGGIDFKKRYAERREEIRRLQIEIGDVYRLTKAIDEEKAMAQVRKWQEKERIKAEIEDWKKNPAHKEEPVPDLDRKTARMEKIDEELFAETKAFDAKKAELERKAEAANEKLKAINYLVGEEHDKQVARIVGEVKNAIDRVAKARGLSGVFNAARFYRYRRPAAKGEFDFHRVYNPAHESLPEGLYSSGNSVKEKIAGHAELGADAVKHALDLQLEKYREAMERADATLEPFQDRNLNDFVVTGGVDVTADVLEEVLRAYKVEEETRNLIVKGVREKKIY